MLFIYALPIIIICAALSIRRVRQTGLLPLIPMLLSVAYMAAFSVDMGHAMDAAQANGLDGAQVIWFGIYWPVAYAAALLITIATPIYISMKAKGQREQRRPSKPLL